MTCAKKVVKCVIETPKGDYFYGDNSVRNPQDVCPREEGEDYTKCKTICDQPGHAEEMALKAARDAGVDVSGGRVFISGIDHYCKSCQRKLYAAGIKELNLE